MDYLILADLYSKVILVHNLPAGQSNSAKLIPILEEWFCDHGTPEVFCTDNGPQYASAAFADCSIEWGFTHETSSPHYPQSNGFAESCVKIVKHTLQHAKCSDKNPRIALQHLKATPVDAKLPSPSQVLYNNKIHTMVPSMIHNTDPAALQFKSTLRIELSMPSPMMISTPSSLHHSLLVSTWPHLTPWGKYGYLLKKFVSSLRTATGGSHLSCTVVKPDSRLAQIFFPKFGFLFPV